MTFETKLEQAVELVDGYRARGKVGLFFLILKEGCRIEALQLESVSRIEAALALYMVVAWRIHRLLRLGRTLAQLPADILFETDGWQAAFILNLEQKATTQVGADAKHRGAPDRPTGRVSGA